MFLTRCNNKSNWLGFTLKPNYYIGYDGTTPIVSSGWICHEHIYVYHFVKNQWSSSWVKKEEVEFHNYMKLKGKFRNLRNLRRKNHDKKV